MRLSMTTESKAVLPPTDGCERYENARQQPVQRESSYRSASLRMLSSLDPTHPRVLLNDV